MERSAHKLGGRPVREPAKSAVLRTPYTKKFGSVGSSFTAVGATQIRTGLKNSRETTIRLNLHLCLGLSQYLPKCGSTS